MKVLLINGSPRARGNTAIALGEMEKIFAECGVETESIHIGNRDIRGCVACNRCVEVCPAGAIRVVNGVAVVNEEKCISCGLCVKACPKGLIELKPVHATVAVQCSNRDRGPQVKAVCQAGCIGCMLCTKQCEDDAVHVENNLAKIDYEKCTQCGKCAAKCPVKVIAAPARSEE